MADTYKQWAYAEDLASADLNMVTSNGVPRFDTVAERDAAIAWPEYGQMCWVKDVPIVPGSVTKQPCFFQARPSGAPSGFTWVPYGLVSKYYQSTQQALSGYTKILLQSRTWDPLDCQVNSTYTEWRCPGTGWYRFYGSVGIQSGSGGLRLTRITPTFGSPIVGGGGSAIHLVSTAAITALPVNVTCWVPVSYMLALEVSAVTVNTYISTGIEPMLEVHAV